MRTTAFRIAALGAMFILPACAGPTPKVVLVSPSHLSFTGPEGGPDPADQQVRLTAADVLFFGQGSWSASTDQPWLRISPSSGTLANGQRVSLAVHVALADGWKGPTSTVGAPAVDPATIGGWGVWTGSAMLVWGGDPAVPGKYYDPVTDTWFGTMSMVGAPSKRTSFTAAWTGTEMIVWGGHSFTPMVALNTGARYNPATDTWTPISTVGAPSARAAHRAVWTGTRMIVWGGDGLGFSYTNTGAIYNPDTDTWESTTSTVNAPSSRGSHAAVWTGTEMLVWGGENPGKFNNGKFYNPTSDTWSGSTTLTGAPVARSHLQGVWTGSEMIVWGGTTGPSANLNTGGRYSPATDSWVDLPVAGAPEARSAHNMVWTGNQMIAWGGVNAVTCLNTGGIYEAGPLAGSHTGHVTISAVSGPARTVGKITVQLTVTP